MDGDFSLKSVDTNANKSIVIFTAIVVAVSVIFYFYIFMPQLDRIAALKSQYQTERQKVDLVENFALLHPDIDKFAAELNDKFNQTEQKLPNAPEIAEFLIQAEQNARESGVQLLSIKPAPTVNKTGYREIPLEIVIRGNFTQTITLLKKLEDTARFNAVNKMSVQSRQGILESKLTVIIYSYGVVPVANQGTTVQPTTLVPPKQ